MKIKGMLKSSKRRNPVIIETYVKTLTPPPEDTRPSKRIVLKNPTNTKEQVATARCS